MTIYATPTRHAATRLQQRSSLHHAVDLLIEFGSMMRCRGASSSHFDHTARGRIGHALDGTELRRVERFPNTYVVVADSENLPTAAWRTRRLRRH